MFIFFASMVEGQAETEEVWDGRGEKKLYNQVFSYDQIQRQKL